MGKNWKSGGKPHRSNDLSSCRGHSVIIATCDVVREREASKELINLLEQTIETIQPYIGQKSTNVEETSHVDPIEKVNQSEAKLSIQQLLSAEIDKIKAVDSSIRRFTSVHTDIKGVILIKIQDDNICPIKFVEEIFNRVEIEKKPISRHIVRMIPLKHTFFPKEDELLEALYEATITEYPGTKLDEAVEAIDKARSAKLAAKATAEVNEEDNEHIDKRTKVSIDDETSISAHLNDSEPSMSLPLKSYPLTTCCINFRARNHNVLSKEIVHQKMQLCLPSFIHLTYKAPKVRKFDYPCHLEDATLTGSTREFS